MTKIPKIIHYCWFSGRPLTPFAKRCIRSWKKVMPDYELRLWTSEDIKDIIQSVPFAKHAYEAKKWAFVADYVRLYALYTEGGIYLDSDVKVIKRFDKFLGCAFFSSNEKTAYYYNKETQSKLQDDGTPIDSDEIVIGMGIQAAIMGSIKGHPFIMDCLDYYQTLTFNISGETDINDYITVFHISRIAAQKYGYKYVDCYQLLSNDMHIYPSSTFVGNMLFYKKREAYAIHLCNGSWHEDKGVKWYIRTYNPYLFDSFVAYPRHILKAFRNIIYWLVDLFYLKKNDSRRI